MPSQGARYPGTVTTASVSTESANDWLTPSNITADDGTEAQITAATYDSPDISFRLVASNFGFTIPTGATINGIVVEIDRRCFAGSAADFRVQLQDAAGVLVGTNKAATGTAWPASLGIATYGNSTDTWAASPTDTMINDPDFGVVLSVSATAANTDIGVDFIRVTVHYTGGTIQQSVSGSLSFTGAITKAISRALSGALSFTGGLTKRTDRSIEGGVTFTGVVVKTTGKSPSGTLTFTASLDPQLLAPGTPALVIIHIHTE